MTYLATSAQSETQSASDRLAEIAQRIGETVTGPAAYEVDREGRFPAESFAALKQEEVLSALVPVERGGMGATITDMSDTVRVLSRYCASTGAILGMHTIEVFLLLRFGTTPALQRTIDELVEHQLLIANANSEAGLGGNVMASIAALEPEGDGWRFDKHALAASYGPYADLIASTTRPSPEAPNTDQVTALFRTADFTLEQTTGWDTLGLRGTRSSGLRMTGHITSDNIFPVPFGDIANGGGGQLRHVLLTAVWTGLAEAAMMEAHKSVRAAARRAIGTTPPSAMRLAEILTDVQVMRSTLADALRQVEAAIQSDSLEDIGLITNLRNTKITITTTAVKVAGAALEICGIDGYRRGADHPLERILRDAYGGLIMVGNDRYRLENAQMLAVRKEI